jgi:hypothetical protein
VPEAKGARFRAARLSFCFPRGRLSPLRETLWLAAAADLQPFFASLSPLRSNPGGDSQCRRALQSGNRASKVSLQVEAVSYGPKTAEVKVKQERENGPISKSRFMPP